MSNGLIAVAALAALVYFATESDNNSTVVDVQGLTTDPGDLQRINEVYQSLVNQGLTPLQLKLCMSQLLLESGILTNVANYTAIDQRHNWAGLTTVSGGYASYNNTDDFAADYIKFLTKGAQPLYASDLTDFNNRLVSNHYYTDNPATYLANLQYYYNLLSQ